MTNEPTTGEIVRALREVVSDPMFRIHEIAKRCRIAADRLESQARTIDELEDECGKLKLTIDLLTARAEQAEKERDELLTDFSTIERDGLCEVCQFGDSSQVSKSDCMEDCCFSYRARRGLPQEGEGV